MEWNMPNWCFNTLVFECDAAGEVDRFRSLVGEADEAFNMDALLPVPEIVRHDAGKQNDWCHANWGTKSNVNPGEAGWAAFPGVAVVRFNSAWTPPVNAVRRLSGMFPTAEVMLIFDEPGVGFSGTRWFRGGHLLEQTD
jgi:hypothetical protein